MVQWVPPLAPSGELKFSYLLMMGAPFMGYIMPSAKGCDESEGAVSEDDEEWEDCTESEEEPNTSERMTGD